MDLSDQNIQPNGFDSKRVSYLLDSAALAEEGGNSRLAIHLYCAAFEASQQNDEGVDERALSGLRQAWILACEEGDRSTAETIFNDLVPYNSDEQTRAALEELQEMAIGQLGLNKTEMENMAVAFANEVRDAGIDVEALIQRFDAAKEQTGVPIDLGEIASSLVRPVPSSHEASLGADETIEVPYPVGSDFGRDQIHPELRYSTLVGFERTKEHMRSFGIADPQDLEMQSFLQQAEVFHGRSGPVLTENFLFVGASREDCGIFAQATANEIGWPVITMIVDVNELGDGTIKVAAPVKRSFFGPPRLTELPNPCTLVIQNIDILQDLFWSEEQDMHRGHGPSGCKNSDDYQKSHQPGRPSGTPSNVGMNGFPQRSLQYEILGYLSALFARGGVFVIATSSISSHEGLPVFGEQLENLIGRMAEIVIDEPTVEERRKVLDYFSEDHPSFNDLDKASLASLSEGMSRYEIISSCHQAVEMAYSESLKKQRHQMVSMEDVLTQFMRYLTQGTIAYRLVEDYLVALFTASIETELIKSDINIDQISIELVDREQNGEPGFEN